MDLPPCGRPLEIVASTGTEDGLPTGPVSPTPVSEALLDDVPRLGDGSLQADGLQSCVSHGQALPKGGKHFDIK